MPAFKVKIVSGNKTWVEIDLLDDTNLSVFDVKAQQVRDASICYDFPDRLYGEIGVASFEHPCAGSACVIFTDQFGQRCSNDLIAYYDYNRNKNHDRGKPHWNVEIRRKRNGQEITKRDKHFEGHKIPDSSEISLIAEFDGVVHRETIKRESIGEPKFRN